MVKKLLDIINTPITLPFKYTNPDIRESACGHGPINRDEEAFIESKVTDKWYCDLVCMVSVEGARFEGEYIVDEKKWYTKEQWKMDREVVEHG